MDPDVLVNLAWASSETEAHLAAHVLEDEGIRAHVVGGTARSGFYTPDLIALSIQVRAADYELASLVLESFLSETPATRRALDSNDCCLACGYDMSGLDDQDVCPECGIDLVHLAREKPRIRLAPPPSDSQSLGVRIGTLLGWLALAVMIAMLLAMAAWVVFAVKAPPPGPPRPP